MTFKAAGSYSYRSALKGFKCLRSVFCSMYWVDCCFSCFWSGTHPISMLETLRRSAANRSDCDLICYSVNLEGNRVIQRATLRWQGLLAHSGSEVDCKPSEWGGFAADCSVQGSRYGLAHRSRRSCLQQWHIVHTAELDWNRRLIRTFMRLRRLIYRVLGNYNLNFNREKSLGNLGG
jgi:hypothetical protein